MDIYMPKTSLRNIFIKPRFRLPLLVSVVVGLLFLAAACGGSDSAEITSPEALRNSDSPAATAQQTQASATTAPVNVNREVGGEVGDLAPEFGGIAAWINGAPLTMEELRGKVVLIDFWTYTCINCIRTYPFLKQWHSRFTDDGLVIVGVHAPEFEFEKDCDNVVEATQINALDWTMAQDNDFVTWRRYSNRFWPAKYLIDKDGVVRYTHFVEGGYAETEDVIRELLAEADPAFLGNSQPLPEDQTIDPVFWWPGTPRLPGSFTAATNAAKATGSSARAATSSRSNTLKTKTRSLPYLYLRHHRRTAASQDLL